MYKHQMNILHDSILPYVDGLKMLHMAATYSALPQGKDRQVLRATVIQQQRQRQDQLRELAGLRDKTERLEEVLLLVNRPKKFREKMVTVKHHLLFD